MNAFALSGLLIGITCTLMAGLVASTNRAAPVNRRWALFCMGVAFWGFSAMLVGLAEDHEVAIVWWRIAHVGVVLIPALFYHFVVVFANISRPKTLVLIYTASIFFLVLNPTPWFIPHTRKVFGEFYYNSPPGLLYIPFVIFFVMVTVLSHVELWRAKRRAESPNQRLLSQWLFLGTGLGFAGGATCFLPVFGIDIYPYGHFAVPLFPLIMTYAFLRYRLMDVDRAVLRGVLFLATYILVVGLPLWVGSVYTDLCKAVLGEWWWMIPTGLMGLLASVSPLIFLSGVHRMEQNLWQRQRRYHRTLIAAASGMIRVKNIEQLCRLIVHMVNRTVGLTHTGLFLYDAKEQRYRLCALRHGQMMPAELTIEQTDPLITLIQETQDLLVLRDLEETLSRYAPEADEKSRQILAAYSWMRRYEMKLIVPSFSSERLLAFLVLGGKRSGEEYTTDDIGIFSALANQALLAIENAMYFEGMRKNEEYMIQSEKLASLGQLASGMAHEIHNPLTIISGEAQLYLERFKGTDAEIDRVLKSIIEECHRAADITRRILRFAKPAPTELAAVDLKTTVEESLVLASYQVKLDQCERIVQVPDDLPKVRSNQNQLQEVVLNLVINACQAMGEQGGKIILSATKRNGSDVELRVADTGPGISPELMKKIFDPFYTTKPTGTGLGLFVTQRILKAHGGSISVESKEGEGACFTICLPIWKD